MSMMPERYLLVHLCLLLCLLSHNNLYAQSPDHLPPLLLSEAFKISARAIDAQTLQVQWTIADGFYLYRSKLRFQSENEAITLGTVSLPPADTLQDPFFGPLNIYRNTLQVDIPIQQRPAEASILKLAVTFQGCPPEEQGCYPPHRQTLDIQLPAREPVDISTPDAPSFSPLSNLFDTETKFLDPEVAFVLSAHATRTSIILNWAIADGYYLYRDKLTFITSDGELGTPQMPDGKIKDDSLFGSVEVYYHELTVTLPLSELAGDADNITLSLGYQGCAEAGLCYPPIEKILTLPFQNADNTSETVEVVAIEPAEPTIDEENPAVRELAEFGDSLGLNENGEIDFLDPEVAFVFSADAPGRDRLVVHWQIADGYYLYRDKLTFTLKAGGQLGTPVWPPGKLKEDPLFGKVEVYQQPLLEILLPLTAKSGVESVTLEVSYQGCAEAGLCYPPISKKIFLPLPKKDSTDTAASGSMPRMSAQDRIARSLATGSFGYIVLAFFGFGLLLAFTPCVFPMIPILSSIIVGQGNKLTTGRAFTLSLVYVLAMALTYAVAGIFAGLVGESLSATLQNPWVLYSFALIFVLLAFSMFGFYDLQIPTSLQARLSMISNRQQSGTLIGVAIMGFLSALIASPCVAAPLAGALIYIGQTGDALLGFVALFVMGLGMGVPLILIGISAGKLLPRAGQWMDNIKAVFGIMLLGVALWMINWLLPGELVMLLWAGLLIVPSVYMGALEPLRAGVSGWYRLWKGIGLMMLVYGILLIIGAASGSTNPLGPLDKLSSSRSASSDSNTEAALQFQPVNGMEDLQKALASAQAANRPVMLDFYADWCVACIEMEHYTFSDPAVQQTLEKFVLLQADVTSNDVQDKALYKHFGIIGPPSIIFYTPDSQEQRAFRVVGFMPATEFNQHLQSFLKNI